MLSSAAPVAFVPSTDLARSRAFYEQVLGLEVIHADTFAVVLRSAHTKLRVTDVGPDLRPQPFTVLGWDVADVHAELAALEVEPLRPEGLEQDAAGVWSAPGGAQVAWFHDPDGNTLSLSHHP